MLTLLVLLFLVLVLLWLFVLIYDDNNLSLLLSSLRVAHCFSSPFVLSLTRFSSHGLMRLNPLVKLVVFGGV